MCWTTLLLRGCVAFFFFFFAIPRAVLSFALCSICNGKSNGSVEECEAYVSGKKKKFPF